MLIGECRFVVKPLQCTPPWPSIQEVRMGTFSNGALAHPESDQVHSPMANVEAAVRLSSGRIHH